MLQELLDYIKKYNEDADLDLITKAFLLADKAHEGQLRKSGEKYIIHPVAVAKILSELNMDTATICAGLLHDVIEDTYVTKEQLVEEFGTEIAEIVDGVTKIKNLNYTKSEESQAENIRKMVLAMSKDIRVVIVKLADRLHNLRTLEYMTDEKRIRIARETLDIYAPLAHRLGISKIKWELEDLCLRHLEPKSYYDLVQKVNKKREEREDELKKIISILEKALAESNIECTIEGRPKNFYSIYKKMKDQNKSFESIYDLTAVRIIVDTVSDCYASLGIVHSIWKPIPGRFKDYIAMPKPNMYQSLHTTVISNDGEIFEVQIRTWEMHKTSEYGIAAHWMYKEKGSKVSAFSQNLKWLQQIMEWQADLADPKEFIDTLKVDFFNDEVFVLTPRGDVIDLPKGSTPVDFAYRVHTDIGNRTIGAKVDGKIVPLNYELSNGNIVEITTSKNTCGPSKDWLRFVKSSRAKGKIRSWFRTVDKDENIRLGKEMLLGELKRLNIKPEDAFTKNNLEELYSYFSLKELDDLYHQIGYGSLKLNIALNKIKSLIESKDVNEGESNIRLSLMTNEKKSPTSVVVDGLPGLKVRFSKCCNPLPGDNIVGFVTKGHGISIHREDCPNAISLKDRLNSVNVKWSDNIEDVFTSDIEITGTDRVGLLSEIAGYMREQKAKLISLNAKVEDQQYVTIQMTVQVDNKKELSKLINELRQIPSILNAYRRIN